MERGHLGDLGVKGRIILEWILNRNIACGCGLDSACEQGSEPRIT